jgi:choline kinase
MKAIILAAGRGSRMKDLTAELPKCLVKLRGQTLIAWQLKAIKEAGINEVAIVTGYKRELLLDLGLKEFHNPRWMETNMVSSLTYADEWLQAEPCIVSYSDIFYQPQAIKLLMATPSDLAVTCDPNWLKLWQKRFPDPLTDAETFLTSENGVLIEIGSKPKSFKEVQAQYMGLLRFTPKAWHELLSLRSVMEPRDRDAMHMTAALQKIIEAGQIDIDTINYELPWGEVDTASDLCLYNENL